MTEHSSQRLITLPLVGDAGDEPDLPALAIPTGTDSPPLLPVRLYRIYYVKRGNIHTTINGREYSVSDGQLIALAPDEAISLAGEAELVALAFHYQFFCIHIRKDEFFCDGVVFNRKNQEPVCTIPSSSRELIASLFDEIRHATETQTSLSQSRAVSALHSMLLQVAECMLRDSPDQRNSTSQTQVKSELTLRFESILNIHFHLRHDVRFYAEALNVTTATLNRRLKRELGKPTSVLIHEKLAIEARRRLSDGKKSVKEVAYMLGFNDQLYFSRFYRKHFDQSPTQYFDSMRNRAD